MAWKRCQKQLNFLESILRSKQLLREKRQKNKSSNFSNGGFVSDFLPWALSDLENAWISCTPLPNTWNQWFSNIWSIWPLSLVDGSYFLLHRWRPTLRTSLPPPSLALMINLWLDLNVSNCGVMILLYSSRQPKALFYYYLIQDQFVYVFSFVVGFKIKYWLKYSMCWFSNNYY